MNWFCPSLTRTIIKLVLWNYTDIDSFSHQDTFSLAERFCWWMHCWAQQLSEVVGTTEVIFCCIIFFTVFDRIFPCGSVWSVISWTEKPSEIWGRTKWAAATVVVITVVVVVATAASAAAAAAAVVTTAVNLDLWQVVRPQWMAIVVEEKN